MSTQVKSADKINMSLDEIIKLNRNQGRKNRFDANRKLNKENKPIFNASNQTANRPKLDTNMSLDEIIKVNRVKKMPPKFNPIAKNSNQVNRFSFKKNDNRTRKFGMPQQQPMSHKPKSFQKSNKFHARRDVKQTTNPAGRQQFNRFLDR